MERTKKIKTIHKGLPTAILTGDWHLQESTPVCRLDDFEKTQWKKVDFIAELSRELKCPVIHSGDLFDYWKPSPALLSETYLHLPNLFSTIYGNHDLPQHNMDLCKKSGVYNLQITEGLNVLPGCHWNELPGKPSILIGKTKILVWHVMTYQGKEPWVNCKASKAAKLLMQYPQFDLIVTGDNHKPFVEEYEGRLLVNPGSIFRMTTDQINHKPRVYVYYAESNTIEPIYLPIEDDVISREHIENKEQRDNRIQAFIETLNSDWQVNLSFEENLESFREANDVDESVMEIIYKSIE